MRILLLLGGAAATLAAAVHTVNVVDRGDILDGRPFGTAGPYERITAKAYFTVDPKLPANARIADIEKAPRNDSGMVGFWADVFVLKPREPAKGNGTVLFEVSNRGGRGMLGTFQNAGRGNQGEWGDGYLFEQGYTLVWVGWQFDVADRPGVLKVHVPKAEGVTGLVRSDWVAEPGATSFSVAAPGHLAYAAASLDDAGAQLSVRDFGDGPRTAIPRSKWRFTDPTTVTMDGGFQTGRIYEVVYRSANPGIAGLGHAAIRDFISFLKYGGGNATALLGDQRRVVKRAIGFGSSQSGRYLRDFVYYGFNADEKDRKVFDGLWPHIAGAARGSFNERFAQPSRTSPYYTIDVFPFRDLEDRDDATGWEGGILARAKASNTVPKIFYTLTSTEYWARSASMMHTSIDGRTDAALAPESRIYHFAGTQHGSGSWPAAKPKDLRYTLNPNDYRPLMRGLLAAMQRWLVDGTEPPASQYAHADQLVRLEDLRYPKMQGFVSPIHVRHAMRLDKSSEPPRQVGEPYPVKLPQVDGDGNEIAGVRMPSVDAPLGSAFGWNLAAKGLGPVGEAAGTPGAWIAFPKDAAARAASRDPRKSIAERYGDRAAYLQRVRQSAEKLVAGRFLLARDVDGIVERAGRQWDDLTK